MFLNREDAGKRLAAECRDYAQDPAGLILALPRGGVAVGYHMSLSLRLPLDVVLTRKIGAPGNPEYALGAVCETGAVFWNQRAVAAFALTAQEQDHAVSEAKEEITRRAALYRHGRSLPSVTDRMVIVVDDGIATGATFLASIVALRRLNPRALVGAIPVGPRDTIEEVAQQVDRLVVLAPPEPFFAVGNFYADFAQLDDGDVLRYLRSAHEALAIH